jgi:hypothetical protein
MLSWTMSVCEAFWSMDFVITDDSGDELMLERVWNKSATPGLSEETEPMDHTSNWHIGRGGGCCRKSSRAAAGPAEFG